MIGAASVVISAGGVCGGVAVPPDFHPYIGGSTNNSVMDLVMGYNGLGRLFGSTGGGGGMAGGSAGSSFGEVPDSNGCSAARWVSRFPGLFLRL